MSGLSGSWSVQGIQAATQKSFESTLTALDPKSVKLACINVFNTLNSKFANIVFDLRRATFQDVETSFEQTKLQIEQMLNNLNCDRRKLILAFNSQSRPVCSRDNQRFDVRAALDCRGHIVLQFVDL
ncbi:MAG TPA: hypothetical protein V6C76_12310 [Drouetiella sp.]